MSQSIFATGAEHPKLKALAYEILRYWDAVVAFVYNPQLPPTNNEAERALRHRSVREACALHRVRLWVLPKPPLSAESQGL